MKGGNAIGPTPKSIISGRFNEAALHEGRKFYYDDEI